MRRATPDDLPVVNRLLAELGRVAVADDLDDPNLIVLLDGDVAVYCVYVARDLGRWTGYATSLAVAPAARGQGLAKKLVAGMMDEVRAFAATHGIGFRVFTTNNPTREATTAILESLGWLHVGEAIGEHGQHLWAWDVQP